MQEPATDRCDVSAGESAGESAARSVDDRDALAAHRAVAAAAGSATGAEGLSALTRGLRLALSLDRAHIHLLESGPAGLNLKLAADAGPHAAFVADAPALASDTETVVTEVAHGGDAVWEGDAYGIGSAATDPANGVSRWRAAVAAQSWAALPLSVRGHTLGVLVLEWPEPHSFDEPERMRIQGIAEAVAVAIDSIVRDSRTARIGPKSVAPAPRTAAVLVGPDGSVAPAGRRVNTAGQAMLISVASSTPPAEDDHASFVDVFGCDGGVFAIVLGTLGLTGSGAERRSETIRHMLRGWLMRGIEPRDALSSLAGWAALGPAEAGWLAVTLAVVDPAKRLLMTASAGPSRIVSLDTGGRAATWRDDMPLLGAQGCVKAAERTRLLLPGDRIGLWVGEPPTSAAGESVLDARTLGSDLARSDAAAALLCDLHEEGACCEAATVLRVLEERPGVDEAASDSE